MNWMWIRSAAWIKLKLLSNCRKEKPFHALLWGRVLLIFLAPEDMKVGQGFLKHTILWVKIKKQKLTNTTKNTPNTNRPQDMKQILSPLRKIFNFMSAKIWQIYSENGKSYWGLTPLILNTFCDSSRGRYHQKLSSQLITLSSQIFPVKNANLQSSG